MARKRLNKNLVLVLSFVAFATLLGVSALVLRNLQQRDPQYFIDLAGQYEKNDDWTTASVFYLKAWDRSRDSSHLVLLGDALLNSGEVEKAVASWRQALVNSPDLTDAHLRQIELFLEMATLNGRASQWNGVKETVQTFLDSQAQPTQAQAAFAHHALGLALTKLANQDEGNAERGEQELRAAMELAPEEVDYAIDVADYLVSNDRVEEGERLFFELKQKHANPGAQAAKIALAYAEYQVAQGEHEAAKESFKRSVALAANAADALRDARLGLANFLASQWRRETLGGGDKSSAESLFDEAESILRGLIATHPDEYEPYLALTSLLRLAERHEDVISVCEARLQRGLSRMGVAATRNRFSTFQLMIYASRAATALAISARIDGDDEAREQWGEDAERYLNDARGEIPTHPQVPAQAARIKLSRGLDRAALEDLRAADEAYRSAGAFEWENKLTLARVHLKLKEAGAAVAVLEEAIGTVSGLPTTDARRILILYAKALLTNYEPNRALVIAERILSVNPKDVEALRVKAAVLEQQGHLEEAGRIIQIAGEPVVSALLRAEQYALEGDVERALTELRKVLGDHPDDERLVTASVRTLVRLERHEEARAVVAKALVASPDDVKLQTLAILTKEGLTLQERERAVLDVIDAQVDSYQRAVERVGFYARSQEPKKTLAAIDMALEHIVAKDTPAARSATVDQHRALLQAKLSAASTLNDDNALDQARDAAARFNVDGAGGKSILGLYHMHKKDYELATRAFREAIEIQPTDAKTLTHLGQCLYESGQAGEAQDVLVRATHISPNHGPAIKSLAIVAKERGDTTVFEEAFGKCLRLIPNDPWVQSELLARQEDAHPSEAIARRQELLDRTPDDVENLIKLVDLCERVEQLDQADTYCKRLLELRPDDAKLVGAIGHYYLRTGRAEESLSVLTCFADSRSTAVERANAQILVAAWYNKQNQPDEVERTLLAAAQVSETLEVRLGLAEYYLRYAGDPAKALGWYEKAVTLARSQQSSELPQVMAQRIACVLQADVIDLALAQTYVDELLQTEPNHSQGLLLLCEVRTRSGDIGAAVSALTDYLRQKPLDHRSRYRRALHYCALGRAQNAIDDLLEIRRADPLAMDLKPRSLLARLHKQGGRLEEWVRELESVVQDAPQSDKALDWLIQAYMETRRYHDAERMLTSRINRPQGQNTAGWLARRSQIARRLGDEQKAIADAQRAAALVNHTPQSVRAVLSLYASYGRSPEGIAYYAQHGAVDPVAPSLRSQYAHLLENTGQADQAVAEFRRAMAGAMATKPGVLRVIAADLRSTFAPGEPCRAAIDRFASAPPPGQLNRGNERVLVALYRIDEQHENATERLESLIQSATDDPQRSRLHRELGDVLQLSGEARRACQSYEEAIKYDEGNWVALNNLAYLLSDEFDEHSRARGFAERAVAVTRSSATLDTLGWVFVGLGDLGSASAQLNEALRLNPGHSLSYYHLGEAYRRGGRWVDAGNVLRQGRGLAQFEDDAEMLERVNRALERVGDSDSAP